MKKNLLLVVLLFLSSLQSHLKAQSINTTLGTVTGVCVGDTVVVPVTVTMASGFSTSAISMAIDYDTTKLRCISSVTSLNSNIATGFLSNCGLFSNLNSGTGPFTPSTRRQFRAAWFALTPVSFNGLMFNLRFVALASTTGSSPIAWDVATAGNCEYADELADVIPGCTFVNGAATIASPASIITQPSGVTGIAAGANTSFTVVAAGSPTYQWQELTQGGSWTNLSNGGVYGGVTTATLTITAATTSLNGNQYRVIVTGGCGAPVTSNALTLSVTSASATGLTAGSASGCQGDTVLVPLTVSGLNAATAFSFKINLPSGTTYVGLANVVSGLSSATGSVASGLLTINWNGSAFTQASGTLMNIRLVLGTQGGTLAWDNATSVTPNSTLSFTNGTLGVTALPVVVTQPVAALTVAEFLGTTISAVTNNATSFRWQKQDVGSSIWNDLNDNNVYFGTGTAVLNISSASLSLNGARYRLRMSSGTCPAQVTSGVCTLTVTPMQITLNALGANARAGDTVIVPIRVSGANAISNMSIYLLYSASNLIFLPALSDSLLNANISVQSITSPTPQIFISYFAGPTINMNQTTVVRLRFRALGSSLLTWSNNSVFSNSIGDVVAPTQITGVSSSVSVTQAVVTVAGSTSFCLGGSVVLNGNTITGATYQWLNASGPISGATNASYTATATGSYRFVITSSSGISDTSTPVSVLVSNPPVTGLLNGNQSICLNGTTTFGSTVSGGIWSSDNPFVATVATSTGVISGISPGTAIISYTVPGTGGCANATATRSVTVTAPPTAGDLSGNQFICVAGTTTVVSTISGGIWSSNDPTIATVDASSGLVTGVAAGIATMTYTVTGIGGCANATATRTVTVTAPPSVGTLSGNQVVCVAGTTTFTSTASSGTWSSSNTAVATVNSSTGLITGVGAGTAIINYTVEGTGGCLDATASLSIQVVEPPLLTNQPLPQSVPVGQNAVFTIGHNSTNSTLQWQTDLGWGFQNLTNAGQYSGVNTPTLTVSNTAFQNNNQMFRCILYNGICSGDTSNIVSLSVVARQNTANVPARFNFQSVIRDTTGALVANRSLGVRITLNRGPQMGTLYSETHQLTSNSNGLITTSIGGGTPVVGSMDSIDWSLGDVYIKTEVDVNGGSNYEILSSNQLLSVPYALYAQNSGSGTPGPAGPQGPMGPAGPQGIQGPAGPAGGGGNGTLAMVRTVGVTEVMYTLARVEASLDASGGEFVVSKGFCLDTLPVPTVDKGIAVAGGGLGSFELGLSGLEAGRLYYVRAYATTAAGTAYGQVLSFQTRALAVPAPTTEAASGVGAFGAQLRGSLADTAGGGMALTARGFRWSQTAGFASASGQDLPAQATAGQGFSAQLQGLTASTTYYFRAYASNSLGTGYGAEISFTTGTQPLPTVQTQIPLGVSQTQALVEGIVTDDAGAVVTARGFCYSTNNNPLISNDTVLAGTGIGTFTATLRNLITDTTYFYRAFAINAGGVGYGLVQSFQTSSGSGSITAPLVTTTPVIRTDSNHVMGGVITWDGNSSISSQGICWNRTGMPTLSDSVILFTPQGLGSFTLAVQLPLGCHEPFYVRAFAQNAVGVSYGNEFLTTNGYQPRLIGTQMTQIGGLTANLQSNVVTTGGCPILERGVCWGTSPNPTNSNSFYGRTICSPDTGVMNCQLNHLFPQTLYYARAYMVNATGTYYGDEVTFTTDTTSELYIGKLHAGGLIFFLDSTRLHGMVITTSDLGSAPWGCIGLEIPGVTNLNNDVIGYGAVNTSLITLHCAQRPIAASVCADLILNGYSDWFLPNNSEWILAIQNLIIRGLGDFPSSYMYATSTQNAATHTCEINPPGWIHCGGFSWKDSNRTVRAVRAF